MYIDSIRIKSGFPKQNVYPFNIPVLQAGSQVHFQSSVCFFVGENGSGKSALLDAISRKAGLLPWGGSKTHRAHHNTYETQLSTYLEITWKKRKQYGFYFRAEAFFNFAASLDDILLDDPERGQYYGGGSLNTQSHGESFLSFFRGYSFQLDGLYLLDEPESALSPKNQVEFVKILTQSGENKQYIIATHSPVLLACPNSQIMTFDTPQISQVSYKETEAYKFYREYLETPERFLRTDE